MPRSHLAIVTSLADLTRSILLSLVFTIYLWILAGRYMSVEHLEMMLRFV